MLKTVLAVLAVTSVISAENVGQQINSFFTDIGKGIEKAANDFAYSVNRFVADNDDLVAAKKIEDQKAIDAYKKGQINDEQLRTALWIDQYQFQQAVDDRIRNQYPGGNSYPDLNGNYWGADSQNTQAVYSPSNGFNGPYDPRVQNSQYYPNQMNQGYNNQMSQNSQYSPNGQANSYNPSLSQNSQYLSPYQNTVDSQNSGYGNKKFAAKKL